MAIVCPQSAWMMAVTDGLLAQVLMRAKMILPQERRAMTLIANKQKIW
jgi:hypothetical protein